METHLHLSPSERAALTAFAARVREELGGDLVDLQLFGSRARGGGDEDSDLDVLVLVEPPWRERERRHRIVDWASDLGATHHVHIAPMVWTRDMLGELERRGRRIVEELRRDGVPL